MHFTAPNSAYKRAVKKSSSGEDQRCGSFRKEGSDIFTLCAGYPPPPPGVSQTFRCDHGASWLVGEFLHLQMNGPSSSSLELLRLRQTSYSEWMTPAHHPAQVSPFFLEEWRWFEMIRTKLNNVCLVNLSNDIDV